MNDLRDELRSYIDGIADPVSPAEAGRAPVRRPRHVRPVLAVALGAAIVLVPVLVLYGLGVLAPAPDVADSPPPATVVTTAPPPPITSAPDTTPDPGTTHPPATIAVPDLIGLPASEAVFKLGDLGLRVETYNVFGEAAPPGLVVDQQPAPGESVEPGATVAVGVSGIAHCESEPPKPAAGEQVIVVYFGCMGTGDGVTPDVSYPTYRIFSEAADPLTSALEGLIAGPTLEERDNGYASFFSEDTADALSSVEFVGSHVIADFDETIIVNNASTSTGMLFFHAELYANVFQFDGIESIEFRLNGSCEAWARSFEGDQCQVMTRDRWQTGLGSSG